MKHLGAFLTFLVANTLTLAPGFILASFWVDQESCIIGAVCVIMSFTYTDISNWKQDKKYHNLLKD